VRRSIGSTVEFTLKILIGIALSTLALRAQPYINYRGVVNAASFTQAGLSGSEIAQGSIFSIFGQNLGPTMPVKVSAFPLQPALAGVSVKVTQGAKSVDALPLVVTAGQINAIMPSNAPLGQVSITVTMAGSTSNPGSATVTVSSFGIFAVNSGGFGPGVLQNFVSQASQPLNTLQATAAPGQVMILWGTGLGPVAADNVAPKAGNLPTQVEIFVGGQLASKMYSGRSSCCSAVDQIVFSVPSNAPLGCYVPVQIRTGGTTLSNAVTMAIANKGAACSDPGNPLSAAFEKGGRLGVAVLSRSTSYVDVDTATPSEVTTDLAALTLRTAPGGDLFFNPVVSMPPNGSCTSYTFRGLSTVFSLPDSFGQLGMELDAGPNFTVSGKRDVSVPRGASSPIYAAPLGSNDPVFGASTLTLEDTGSTKVSTAGGAGVGAVSITIPAPPTLNWTNRLQLTAVNRAQPLTVNWSAAGLENSLMIVSVANYDLASDAQRLSVCAADAGTGSFTIPAYIMQALPQSSGKVGKSSGGVMLGLFPSKNVVPFNASGIDTGLAVEVVSSSKTMLFQ
jgi:uncharacterized protein (TIGR03437 family)